MKRSFNLGSLLYSLWLLLVPLSSNEPVVHKIKEKLRHLKFKSFRREAKVSLIERSQEQLNRLGKERYIGAAKSRKNDADTVNLPGTQPPSGKRSGFIVLGMHRSGTSMLAGLLVTGLGYEVGGPLIGSNFDNKKGFFEQLNVVWQNDEFMKLQQIDWSANVYHYDYKKALDAKESGAAKFSYGKGALLFLNNAYNAPWIQKDPRMCITLKTWLPLMANEPAVLWTYRHPMEVAHSLIARESSFSKMVARALFWRGPSPRPLPNWRPSLDRALRLWIVYNMRGIQNSAGLCRVYTSNDAILADPLTEAKRISQQLSDKCGVPPPPNALTEDQVSKLVDTSLQYSKKKVGEDLPVIEEHGNCKVHDFVTTTKQTDPRYQRERKLYLVAMKLYCDMGNGQAYRDEYMWPDLEDPELSTPEWPVHSRHSTSYGGHLYP
jgi:hypothetical protein